MAPGQETSADSSTLAQLKRLVELYESRQAKSVAYSTVASVGVGLLAVAIGTGLIAAWSYYRDSMESVQQTKKAVDTLAMNTKASVDALNQKIGSLEAQLGVWNNDVQFSPPDGVLQSNDTPPIPNVRPYGGDGSVLCNNGYYVVGLYVSKGSTNLLNGLKLICRKLNAKG
jgi:hypothetical protein